MKVLESEKVVPLFRLLLMGNPCADEICNTVQSLVDRASFEVEDTKNTYIKKLCDESCEVSCENRKLTEQVKKLSAELEKKRTTLKEFPFEVGEKVWAVKSVIAEDLICSKCNGNGRIQIEYEGHGLTAECPVCHGNLYAKTNKRCVRWQRYETQKDTVQMIRYDKKDGFECFLSQGAIYIQASRIFAEADRDKAEALANELTAKAKEDAERRLRGEE